MSDSRPVLLVEDNEMNRDMMVRRLKRAGLEVVTAGDGQEALDVMRAERPAVVLMDINLPVMDGWTASRTAKEDDALKDIPIIALTAHAMEEDRLNAMQCGCDDYATKPVDFPALLAKLDAVAGRVL